MPEQKILIVKPSSLGDIVHSLPFLNSLRGRLPHAEVHWLVAWGLHELLEGHPMLDKLWVVRKDQWKRISRAGETVRELRALYSDLRRERFDLVVDLQGLLRSGLITMATKAPRRVGFKEAREGSTLFYTERVKGGRDVHAVERYLKLAEGLGYEAKVQYPFPPLPTLPGRLPAEYVVMAPSARGEAKLWPPERFGELASRLPLKSVVLTAKADAHLADMVFGASKGRAISLAGKTSLKEMAAVIKGARYLVSNDTGPMHIAAAFDVPVFALFGPTSPVRTGPYGDIHTVISADLECAPCYRRRKCRDWLCMEGISVDMVYDTITRGPTPHRS
jgi:lipopolysaccharide heptosyltransferase I